MGDGEESASRDGRRSTAMIKEKREPIPTDTREESYVRSDQDRLIETVEDATVTSHNAERRRSMTTIIQRVEGALLVTVISEGTHMPRR